ncbi:unnamed protein product [Closterium sp. NIES-65]|nr:unnamed protein product [Closterium sp. NIES-65]
METTTSQLASPECSSVSAEELTRFAMLTPLPASPLLFLPINSSSVCMSPLVLSCRPTAGSSLTNFPISELYHVEHYLKAVQRQPDGASHCPVDPRHHATPGAHDGSDQAIFERDPIPTSLTRLPTALQKKAVGIFEEILHYMGLKGALVTDERGMAQTVIRILKLALGKPEMREELYTQLHKQTWNNHDREACLRAWEVMHLCASVAPPGEQLGKPITDYVQEVANDAAVDAEVKSQAIATWHALNKAMKVGARKTVPTVDELLTLKTGQALRTGRALTGRVLKTVAFFLDDTFKEVWYDASTTAAKILESVASSIRLEAFQSFGLYEHMNYETLANNNLKNASNEYVGIDDKAYMGDVMAGMMSFRERSERQVEQRLIFRKRFFRRNEEAIMDQVFVHLTSVQVKQDFEEGNYPVSSENVAQLAALQLIVDFGLLLKSEVDVDWQAEVEKIIPDQFRPMRQKRGWAMDLLTHYKALSKLTPEEAKQQFLTIIQALPYGESSFHHLRCIQGPIEMLPKRVLIGINSHGAHFFQPVSKEYLHSAGLRDIKTFGSDGAVLHLEMRVVDSMHVFLFETSQGEEICLAMQTHINDAEARRLARRRRGEESDYEHRTKEELSESAFVHIEQIKTLELRFSKERAELEARLATAEQRWKESRAAEAQLREEVRVKEAQSRHLEELFKELDELRETKKEMERNQVEDLELIQRQRKQIAELEKAYKEEIVLRKRYYNMEDMKGKIHVYARSRPLSGRERGEGQHMVLEMPDEFTLQHPNTLKEGGAPKSYQFDRIFDHTASQEAVFEDTRYLIQSAIDGYNVCIFSYGQTGSGKTHTIHGTDEDPKLTPRAMQELFDRRTKDAGNKSYKLKVYMVQLYQDKLEDLLLPKNAPTRKLEPKMDSKGMVMVMVLNATLFKVPCLSQLEVVVQRGMERRMVVVENATLVDVDSLSELKTAVQGGMERRKVAPTKMNAESSRSHLVLSIIMETTDVHTNDVSRGKLSFVDLAGSENAKKSGLEGERLREAQSINLSLSALGNVISALASGPGGHIPYRSHKLTMLMSDSLGGNAKTLMLVNVSPAQGNLSETHNSLTYATRVRSITNDASKNVAHKEEQWFKNRIRYWKQKAGASPEKEELDEVKDKRTVVKKVRLGGKQGGKE